MMEMEINTKDIRYLEGNPALCRQFRNRQQIPWSIGGACRTWRTSETMVDGLSHVTIWMIPKQNKSVVTFLIYICIGNDYERLKSTQTAANDSPSMLAQFLQSGQYGESRRAIQARSRFVQENNWIGF